MSVLGVKIYIAGGPVECRMSHEAMNRLARLSKDNNVLLSNKNGGDTLFLFAGSVSGLMTTSPHIVRNFTYFSEVEIINEIPEWENNSD